MKSKIFNNISYEWEEVMEEYDLIREDILAALEYAAAIIDVEDVLPLAVPDAVPA